MALARTGDTAQAKETLDTYRRNLEKASKVNGAKITQIDGWIAALAAGRDPFDAAALTQLREEC